MLVRTRFAPSPTGYVHLGNIRTALYCWLYAKKTSGEFILRIEDTDLERSTEEAIKVILEGLAWLGLNYDEGPFYQTKRMDLYRKVVDDLLQSGKAYRCNCSKERLTSLREQQSMRKEKPRYDGCCRNKNLPHGDEPYVIRFKNPEDGEVTFEDKVCGKITFRNDELDDLIIMRTDGSPTYNLCVVIDDLDMKITHVIRGADHINNTPRQINIFQALGAKPPTYAHVPLILGKDGKLLSKSHGAQSILQYREEGFMPEAMLNYLVRLGWSHGDQEIFRAEEMINFFDIKDINKAAAAFDPEKLLWLNRHYLKTLDPNIVAAQLKWHMDELKIDITHGPSLPDVVKALCERSETLREMAVKSRFFYEEFTDYEESSKKHLSKEVLEVLKLALHRCEILQSWIKDSLHEIITDIAKQFDLKLGQVAQPIRVAITGGTVSPPIDITLQLLGKKVVLARLRKALNFIIR